MKSDERQVSEVGEKPVFLPLPDVPDVNDSNDFMLGMPDPNAKEEDNASAAKKYFEMVLLENPDDWEANFYSAYYTILNGKTV